MLALFAGQGRLPVLLTQRLAKTGQGFQVYEMVGHRFENPENLPVQEFRFEQLGSLIKQAIKDGVTSVCFAGAIKRPVIDPELIDAETAPLVSKIKSAIAAGDDAGLRTLLALFSDQGLAVVSAQDIAPELLQGSGILTARKPYPQIKLEIGKGWDVLAEQGAADLGQACVISNGRVLARETLAGTDAMLAGLGKLNGGILFKGPKPMQDLRVDMPTIGLTTVSGVANAGLDGIVLAAGAVLILDLADVIKACDSANLFLLVTEQT